MSKAALGIVLGGAILIGACVAFAGSPGSIGAGAPPDTFFTIGPVVVKMLARPEQTPIALTLRNPAGGSLDTVLNVPVGPTGSKAAEAAPAAARMREIVWRPSPDGQSEFGAIPTEWTARPQLLPGTWEVETVFATREGSARQSLTKGAR